jgi:hypothetical protein
MTSEPEPKLAPEAKNAIAMAFDGTGSVKALVKWARALRQQSRNFLYSNVYQAPPIHAIGHGRYQEPQGPRKA